MARTLTILGTLPKKISNFKRQIEAQFKIIGQAKQNYDTQLNHHRVKIQDTVNKAYNKFRGRPYLVAAQLVALLLYLSCRDNRLVASLIVVTSLSLFITCFKPIWFWFLWHMDSTKPRYPARQINGCRNVIRDLEEEIRKHLQGLQGEQLVAYHLADRLPESYNVINDVTVYFQNKRVQMDHVVVGPTGIFAVETKNITGNYFPDAQGWLRYPAHTIKGIPVRNYRRMVVSCPQEQSLTQARALVNFLATRGITVKVNNVVVITNQQCKWNGGPKDNRAPVVNLPSLIRYILTQKQYLNDQEVREIIATLLKLQTIKPLSVRKS